MKYSQQQEFCIKATGGPILISAAAGSGKTTVLVEHILHLLRQKCDIDRLLIVTFTRTAAAEMRQRLQKKLQAAIAEEPENAELFRRQQLLLPRAHIGTIDALCQKLLSEYYYLLEDIPPRMTISQEQADALLSEVIEETVDKAFSERGEEMRALAVAVQHSSKKASLHTLLRQLYVFAEKLQRPEDWLQKNACPPNEAAILAARLAQVQTRVEQSLVPLARARAARALLMNMHLLCDAAALPVNKRKGRMTALSKGETLLKEAELSLKVLQPPFRPDAVKIGKNSALSYIDPALAKGLSELCARFDSEFKELASSVTVLNSCEPTPADIPQHLQLLCQLTVQIRQTVAQRKIARRVTTFSDTTALVLRLLGNGDTPTELAQTLSKQYAQVMVDEYQDVSEQQDLIFVRLSDEGKNLYMVGDVKQSIYNFRQARPQLFLRRYHAYPDYREGNKGAARIRLNTNYRSRPEITDIANFVCRQIITPDLCGVDYTQEQLNPNRTERGFGSAALLLTQGSADLPLYEWDARHLAAHLSEMMASVTVPDKDADGNTIQRPMRPSDICVLLRFRTHADVYVQELKRVGIPAAADCPFSFVQTASVQTVLALLRTINDATADIPLAATLMSPLFGFTPDDLTLLRCRGNNLYASLQIAANSQTEPLRSMCTDFLNKLQGWRRLSQTCSVCELVEKLYDSCGLPAVLGGQDEQGALALEILLDHVRAFDSNGFRGLSAYLRRLDRTQPPEAKPSPKKDAAFVTTIHQSKGLEYPVVALADIGILYERTRDPKMLLSHPEQGLALKTFCPSTASVNKNLHYLSVEEELKKDRLAEEIRLLYVALTRAKEHLIICCAARDMTSLEANKNFFAKLRLNFEDWAIPADLLMQANCASYYLMSSLLRHPDLADLVGNRSVTLSEQSHITVKRMDNPPLPQPVSCTAAETVATVDDALLQQLRQRAVWQYPYAQLDCIPVKCAVSQLARELTDPSDEASFTIPDFARTQQLSGAQRGTAHHLFMQFVDMHNTDVEAEIVRCTRQGYLSARQAAALNRPNLQRFFDSPLYRRILDASGYEREVPFTFALPAREYPGAPDGIEADETVLIQGIADAVLIESDGIVLLDFKTDRGITAAQLSERYAAQLQLYARALRQIYERPIKQALLYSFELGKEIQIPL